MILGIWVWWGEGAGRMEVVLRTREVTFILSVNE